MTFMEALSKRPVAYYKLDQDVLIDSSGYNRPVSVTNRTNGIPTHSDSTRSLILNGVSALTLGSPVFTSNRDSDFTLEADIVPIAQTEGNLPQTYYENLVYQPSPIGSLSQWASRWFGNGATGTNERIAAAALVSSASGWRKTWTTTNSVGQDVGVQYNWNHGNIVPGKTYNFSAFLRASWATQNQIIIQWLDSSGGSISTSSSTREGVQANVIHRFSFAAIAPQGAVKANFIWGPYPATAIAIPAGATLDMDGVQITEGSDLKPYIDGNMIGYEWSGSAYASTSKTRSDVSRSNLVFNPDAINLVGFGVSQWTNIRSAGNGKVGFEPKGNGSDTFLFIGGDTGGMRLGMQKGHTYTASVFMEVPAGYTNAVANANRRITFWYRTNAGYQLIMGNQIAPGSSGFSTVTVTIPNSSTETFIRIYNGSNTVSDEILLSKFQIEEGGTNSSFFSGSSVGAGWSGTVNNSPSFLYTSQGTQSIISNTKDGLTINGTVISFSTRHGDGTIEAKCSYDLGERTRTHVTAQHTKRKNTLYVDDEIVAEVDVPELALYAPATTLTSGPTNSGQAVAINNIGIYDRILSRGEIAENAAASAYFFSNDTQSVFQAEEVDVSTIVYSPYFTQEYTNSYPGIMTNVVESFDELVPSEFNGAAVAGTWEFTVPLSLVDNPKTLTNSYVQWSGSGFTVQASLVTDVWFDVVENKDIVQLRNYNGQDKDITFRVTFTEGSVDSYLSMFRFITFADLTFSKNGFTYTMNNDVRSYEEGIVFEQTEKRGISVGTSFSFKRDAAEESPQPVKTIELVVKQTGNSEPTLSAAYSPTAGYTNGESGNTYTKGAYVIKHIVAPAGIDLSQNVTVSGEFDLMSIKLYPDALTQDQIKQIIATYTGTIKTRISDTNVVGVTENASSTSIYAYDWSTSSSRGQ